MYFKMCYKLYSYTTNLTEHLMISEQILLSTCYASAVQ